MYIEETKRAAWLLASKEGQAAYTAKDPEGRWHVVCVERRAFLRHPNVTDITLAVVMATVLDTGEKAIRCITVREDRILHERWFNSEEEALAAFDARAEQWSQREVKSFADWDVLCDLYRWMIRHEADAQVSMGHSRFYAFKSLVARAIGLHPL